MEEWRGLKILIVDDEPSLRDAVKLEIETLGCEVLQSGSGHAAKELLETTEVGLILSDIRMPDGDGIDLLNHVQAKHPSLPMILMSGFADIAVWEAYDWGAAAYIGKPFNIESLEPYLRLARRAEETAWDKPTVVDEPPSAVVESTGPVGLGRGGFFVKAITCPAAKNAVVRFNISGADGVASRLQGTGIVRWIRSRPMHTLAPGYGVEFLSLESHSLAWVRQALSSKRHRAYIPSSELST